MTSRTQSLAQCSPRPRRATAPRGYPRLIEVGLCALAAVGCGGEVDATPQGGTGGAGSTGSGGGEVDGDMPMPYTGGSGGLPLAGNIAPPYTGGSGGGEVDGDMPMPYTGGVSSAGGMLAGGVGPVFEGWTSVRIRRDSNCVGVNQPLDVSVQADEWEGTVMVSGTRSVVSDDGACMENSGPECLVAEEFTTIHTGEEAYDLHSLFAAIPLSTCEEGAWECDEACNNVDLEIDGIPYGSTGCCGPRSAPEYPETALTATDRLMEAVAEQLAEVIE